MRQVVAALLLATICTLPAAGLSGPVFDAQRIPHCFGPEGSEAYRASVVPQLSPSADGPYGRQLDPIGFCPFWDPQAFGPKWDPHGFGCEWDPIGYSPQCDPHGYGPLWDPIGYGPQWDRVDAGPQWDPIGFGPGSGLP